MVHLISVADISLNTSGKPLNTSGKHVRVMNTPYAQLSNSKTGARRGIPIFLIHRLLIHVRTASVRPF